MGNLVSFNKTTSFSVELNLWKTWHEHKTISNMSQCGFCYKPNAISLCSKCRKRSYCSRECQIGDWKCGHKQWCGVAGELGTDYEIRESNIARKGMAMFALRPFAKNEKILAERYVMSEEYKEYNIVPPEHFESILASVATLEPSNSTDIATKFHMNCIACSSDNSGPSGLFLNSSRINHDCIGNSEHFYIPHHNVMIVFASRNIAAGEEITFSYISDYNHKPLLSMKWNFECTCIACTDEVTGKSLLAMKKLDDDVLRLGSIGRVEQAIVTAKRLLIIYDTYNLSAIHYARTYYDLFSLNICKRSTFTEAEKYIKLAYEAEAAIYSGCNDMECGSMAKYRGLIENPASHPNYRALG